LMVRYKQGCLLVQNVLLRFQKLKLIIAQKKNFIFLDEGLNLNKVP
jgi:hypothetical protein